TPGGTRVVGRALHARVLQPGVPAGGVQRAPFGRATLRPLVVIDPRPGGNRRVSDDPRVPRADARRAARFGDRDRRSPAAGRLRRVLAGAGGSRRPVRSRGCGVRVLRRDPGGLRPPPALSFSPLKAARGNVRSRTKRVYGGVRRFRTAGEYAASPLR